MSTKRQDKTLTISLENEQWADMFDFESTSRDEAAIGQLKIGVLLHDVTCEVTSSSSIFLFFFTFQNFVSQ